MSKWGLLVPAFSTLLGALVGMYASIIVTKHQLALSFGQFRQEVIERRIVRLEKVLEQTSRKTTEYDNPAIQQADLFRKVAVEFLNVSYMFPQEIEDKVIALVADMEGIISLVQHNQPVTDAERMKVWGVIPGLTKEIDRHIRAKLRKLLSEQDRLTSGIH